MAPAIPRDAPPATVDIAYIYRRRNFVDVLENVSVLAPVTVLREQLCKRFNEGLKIDVSPEAIRLNTLLKVDGEWPAESDAKHAESRPTIISSSAGTEFEGGPCAFEIGEFETREIYRKVTVDESYKMEKKALPASVAQGIREDYERLVGSSPAPWNQNEAPKHRYIDAVLTRCIFAINCSNSNKSDLSDLSEDQKLLLYPDFPIVVPGLNVSGNADWVVKKGDRTLIVHEAKGCDIEKGYHQLLGMMEAVRINNKILKLPQHKMKAICTDFQNWLFVERENYTLRKDIHGTKIPTNVFDEDLIRICEYVYITLLDF